MNGFSKILKPANEPAHDYRRQEERAKLKNAIADLKAEVHEIPLLINGKEVWTDTKKTIPLPYETSHVLASYSVAGEKELKAAIDAALAAKKEWVELSFESRMAIFMKAAELISGPYRELINAATMLGQSKTWLQAELDSACELIDFLRFNCYFASEIYHDQPGSDRREWNTTVYRPLEGFVTAITPFNFTAIGGNLPTAPAIMGNTVIWKPSSNAVLSNYIVMDILKKAGLPDGVINFLPSRGQDVSRHVLSHPSLAGVHFTGSTEVFKQIWSDIGVNIDIYDDYPRIVGETGGKDFVFVDVSADIELLTDCIIDGAFQYQGQKCSAVSRVYIPNSTWPVVWAALEKKLAKLTVDSVENFEADMSAVINEEAFASITGYLERAKKDPKVQIIWGGQYSDADGFFIHPSVILTTDPHSETMEEEIFGPVLTIYCYEDSDFEDTLELCNKTSPYGLTGAIFSNNPARLELMEKHLRYAAGNFYINDKPTGAVVGKQPFGGSRKSGTNDKAGSKSNLMRWVSPQTIKRRLL